MKIRIIKASDNKGKTVTFHMEIKGFFRWRRVGRYVDRNWYELPFKSYEECETEMFKEFFKSQGEVIQRGNVYTYKQYSYSI